MSPSLFARAALTLVFLAALAVSVVLNSSQYLGMPAWDAVFTLFSNPTLQGVRENSARFIDLANKEYIGRYEGAEIRTRIAVALGKHEMNNLSVIRGLNGHLYAGSLFPLDLKNARKLARALALLDNVAAEAGTKMLYLSPPPSGYPKPENIPAGLPVLDFSVSTDNFVYKLRETGVPFVDSRFYYTSRGMPLDTLSIRSGYILTIDALFALHSCLVEALERKSGVFLDPDEQYRNRDNYTFTTYPEFFMGTLGKRTGPAFGGVDDFVTVTPAFPTDFEFESLDMFGVTTKAEGDAKATFLNPAALQGMENLYYFYPDSFYRHSVTTWSKTVNKLNADKPRILLVHDLFTAPLASLLAPLCSELHTLSYQQNQTENVENYIKDKNFDCIVVSYFPGGILELGNQLLLLGWELEDEPEDDVDEPEGEKEFSDVL